MNAVYYLGPRMGLARKWGKETIAGGGLNNKQFNDFVPAGDPLAQFFVPPSTTWTPRVLKDGSDSVGALGALNRVYINIGLFSEEWLLHFRAAHRRRADLADSARDRAEELRRTGWRPRCRRRTWRASSSPARDPHYLKDAPGGAGYLTEDAATLERGKVVFAERCARCHSSKLPPLPAGLDLENANGPNYLDGVERVLGVDQDRGVQDADAGDRARPTTS